MSRKKTVKRHQKKKRGHVVRLDPGLIKTIKKEQLLYETVSATLRRMLGFPPEEFVKGESCVSEDSLEQSR